VIPLTNDGDIIRRAPARSLRGEPLDSSSGAALCDDRAASSPRRAQTGSATAEIDVVAEEEDDDVLRLFSHQREHTLEARRFWAEQVGTKEAMMTAQELEEYQEIAQHFLDLMSPEKRLIGLAPEQVERALGILSPEQLLVVMPPEVLRALSDEFVDQLPEPTRSTVRARRGR